MTFEYENLLLLKSTQNNVTSNIAITEKKTKQVRHIIYVREILMGILKLILCGLSFLRN